LQHELLNIQTTTWGLAALATLVAALASRDQHALIIFRRHGKLMAHARIPGIQLDSTLEEEARLAGVMMRRRK